MSDDSAGPRNRAIPSGRLSRLSHFGRLAGGMAGGMMAEGARRPAAGERPRISDLILTPGNAKRSQIEGLTDAPQAVRDKAMTALIELVLRELFEIGWMQTDPNFANYRWQPDTERLVLLDFGATRAVPEATARSYRALIVARLAHDRDRIREIAVETGLLGAAAVAAHRPAGDRIIAAIDDTMARPGPSTSATVRSSRSSGRRPLRSCRTAGRGTSRTSRRSSCSGR